MTLAQQIAREKYARRPAADPAPVTDEVDDADGACAASVRPLVPLTTPVRPLVPLGGSGASDGACAPSGADLIDDADDLIADDADLIADDADLIDDADDLIADDADLIADDDADLIADDDLAGLTVIDLDDADDADDDDADADGKRRPNLHSNSAAVYLVEPAMTYAEWQTVNGYDEAKRAYTADRVHLIEPRPPREVSS